jgi:hypothetical protein
MADFGPATVEMLQGPSEPILLDTIRALTAFKRDVRRPALAEPGRRTSPVPVAHASLLPAERAKRRRLDVRVEQG